MGGRELLEEYSKCETSDKVRAAEEKYLASLEKDREDRERDKVEWEKKLAAKKLGGKCSPV